MEPSDQVFRVVYLLGKTPLTTVTVPLSTFSCKLGQSANINMLTVIVHVFYIIFK